MPGWDTLRSLVREEFKQSMEEGKEPAAVEALRKRFEAAGDDPHELEAIHAALLATPMRRNFPFDEPSELGAIRSLRSDGPHELDLKLSEGELHDRMHGAWLGRCVGCALGKPVEGFMGEHNGLSSKERIKRYLVAISPDEYPLRFYFPAHSPAEGQTGKLGCPLSTREQIAFMETDDDIRYTVLGQKILCAKGAAFTSEDVMLAWMSELPYRDVCTAETQAYRNFILRYEAHTATWRGERQEIDWDWVTTHLNPYREWIGAQIRADSWGYAAPGNPELAAEFAWRDARISHVKNGIYGEMFVAAMIAAAFVLDDMAEVVAAGLREIPKTSRLHAEMEQVAAIATKHGRAFRNFEAALDDVYALLGHYHPVHTNNNAGLVVLALLLGEKDLEKTVSLAVMGGWDTDCNGATAGSILGAMVGGGAMPAKWTDPLHDTLNSKLAGYHPIGISECARRSVNVAQEVCNALGVKRA